MILGKNFQPKHTRLSACPVWELEHWQILKLPRTTCIFADIAPYHVMESLPLELIQSIGGFLAPEAIDPFTSTSKHIRRVLTRLIDEHQSFKRDFEHAICGENQPHGSIVDLLLNVLIRSHLHYYVRKLTVED